MTLIIDIRKKETYKAKWGNWRIQNKTWTIQDPRGLWRTVHSYPQKNIKGGEGAIKEKKFKKYNKIKL